MDDDGTCVTFMFPLVSIDELLFLTHRHLMPIFGAGVDASLPPWNPTEDAAASKTSSTASAAAASSSSNSYSSPSASSSSSSPLSLSRILAMIFATEDKNNNVNNNNNNNNNNKEECANDVALMRPLWPAFIVVGLFAVIGFFLFG